MKLATEAVLNSSPSASGTYGKGNSGSLEVGEDFLGFVELPETDAATVTDAILTALKKWNVDLRKWRGKGFDGTPTMSGLLSGVNVRIQRILPQAKYFTRCRNYYLNLVIVNSCQSVPEIRAFMESLKEMAIFVNYCAKRKHIMLTNVSEKVVDDITKDLDLEEREEELLETASHRQGLPTLSDTRWLFRVDCISTLLVKYEEIFTSMESMLTSQQAKLSMMPCHM